MSSNDFLAKAYEEKFSEVFPFGFLISVNKKDIMLGDTVYSVAIRGNIEKDIVLYEYCSNALSLEEAYKTLSDTLDDLLAQYEEFLEGEEDNGMEFLDIQLSCRSFYETNEDYFLDEYAEDIPSMISYNFSMCNNNPKETLQTLLMNDIEYLFSNSFVNPRHL